MKAKNHEKKFKRWQQKVCQPTRLLSELVKQNIVAFFENSGFERVDVSLGNPDLSVSMDSLELERWSDHEIDSVTVSFAKYGEPKFQIHCSRRKVDPPNDFVRAANLVKKPSHYYDFWGKPWWLPSRLWSVNSAKSIVSEVESLLPQIIVFLESGSRGKNIGLDV